MTAQFHAMKKNRNIISISFMNACPYKRHYHSTLSIWLSVDPMSDKYPGLSPYTYCANNPVRLVDPDGRAWVNPKEDEEKYTILRAAAVTARDKYDKGTEEYNLIQEGIDGLDFMKQDTKNKYTFDELYKDSWDLEKNDNAGYVSIEGCGTPSKTFHICYLHDEKGVGFTTLEQGEAWHEVTHLSRALKKLCMGDYMSWKTGEEHGWAIPETPAYRIRTNKHLGVLPSDIQEEEFKAYKSQLLVYPSSMPIPYNCISGKISTDEQIKAYVEGHYK